MLPLVRFDLSGESVHRSFECRVAILAVVPGDTDGVTPREGGALVMRRRMILSGLTVPIGLATSGLTLAACGEGSDAPKEGSGAAAGAKPADGAAKPADTGGKPAAGAPQGTPIVAATADPKKVAATLLPKVVAFIDAVNSKDQAKIASAKKEMQQEADKSDEAVRNSTGPAANAVNAALNNIRLSVMSNDVKTLERAKQLLEDASK